MTISSAPRQGSFHIPSLLIGVGLATVLGIAFTFVADAALRSEEPGEFDKNLVIRLKRTADKHPDNTPWIKAVTYLGSRYVLAGIALAGTFWQFWRGRGWLAIAWFLIAAGGGLLNEGVKRMTARDRPPEFFRDAAVTENLSSYSFPSGHATGSMIGFGLVCYVMVLQAKKPLHRILPFVDAAVIVAAVGFSRVYLRVHWATDVMGGLLLGGAWLALWLGILEAGRRGKGIVMESMPAVVEKRE
jgi:membrane-associated phospholipid phosphatase